LRRPRLKPGSRTAEASFGGSKRIPVPVAAWHGVFSVSLDALPAVESDFANSLRRRLLQF
jgi:hypothetical protein